MYLYVSVIMGTASSYHHVIRTYLSGRHMAGTYRKQLKRGYSKVVYSQRNKEETTILFSVMKKRLFGEYLTSVLVRTQNRERTGL